jgi:hypothetical protein
MPIDDDDDRPVRRPRRDDDDDDRPARRPKNARDDDDEDDDRPTRRSRRDVEDDYDDAPRSRRSEPDGMGVASMICGIAALVLMVGCCVPIVNYIAGPLSLISAIVAVILGFLAKKKNPKSGKALAGIITGFIAVGLDVIILIITLIGVGIMMNAK